MIQYNLVKNEYEPDLFRMKGVERPPMLEVPAYRNRFGQES